MKTVKRNSRTTGGFAACIAALAVAALVTGCDSSRDPILGSGTLAGIVPSVTAVAPLNNATGVPINSAVITADFSTDMAPLTGANFTVTCVAPCVSPLGTVTLDAGNRTATFAASAALVPFTVYTATVSGATALSNGVAMTTPHVWTFTTSDVADTIRPTVTLTSPTTTIPGPTLLVPLNTAISATFSESMSATSLTQVGRFTVTCVFPCTSPAGVVTYSVGSRTATFTPSAPLALGATYTATLAATVTDVSGNGLAGNQPPPAPAASSYVWTFTTSAAAPTGLVTVQPLSLVPAANAVAVCPTRDIKATFNVPSGLRMADASVTSATFTVKGPGPAFTPVLAESVVLDGGTGRTATFTPATMLDAGVTYTVTIKSGVSGVKDTALPANRMFNDFTWSFTAGAPTGLCLPPVELGLLSTFGIAATAGISNTTLLPLTVINGDVALDPVSGATCNSVQIDAIGGFGLCGSNGSTPILNGSVISPLYPDAGVTSGNIKAALLATFLSITPPAGPPAAGSLGGATNLPAGTTLGAPTGNALVQGDNLFVPGVYQSLTSILVTGDLTLDAQGDADAVFIFQSSSSVGAAAGAASPAAHTRILLVNGAKAANVWWQAGTSATLGTHAEFVGNILASESITMETGASSCGRLLAGAFAAGAFVFDSNVVSVPGNGCPE